MTKLELEELILYKENELRLAESESQGWNAGKHRYSSNSKLSKIFVTSLRREIENLRQQFSEINSQ